jgi:hypothetical protein
MFNPWSDYRVSGSWEDHQSYSYGGTDWPLAYGTPLLAVASGTLTDYGWVGSAGRRAGLKFDTPVRRLRAPSKTAMHGGSVPYYEHDCDMTTFIYQHAADYEPNGHYDEGDKVGLSGASANGKEWGGSAHLHGHGLCEHGARVDFMKFIPVSGPAGGGGSTPITNRKANLMEAYVVAPNGVVVHVFGGGKKNFESETEYNAWRSEVLFFKKYGTDNGVAIVSNVATPPPLDKLPKLGSWAAFERLCENFGAPTT